MEIFIPVKYRKKLSKNFMEEIAGIKYKKIGLFATIQFIDQLYQLEKFLIKKGKNVFVGKPKYRAVERGQVLGCDISSAISISNEVDCYIYLGSGYFHVIPILLKINKPIFQANPITEKIDYINEKIERYRKLRELSIAKAKKANVYGILVSIKKGQYNIKLAEKIKKILEKKGKKAYIFLFDTLNPEDLINFPQIEAWINTACPRIAIDDIERFDKPVINPEDLSDLK